VRTVPVPNWVYDNLKEWLAAAGIQSGKLFRRVSSAGKPWGDGVTEKLVWHVVKEFAAKIEISKLAPHDLRRYAESRTMPNRYKGSSFGGELGDQSDQLIRHSQVGIRGPLKRPKGHHRVGSGPPWC